MTIVHQFSASLSNFFLTILKIEKNSATFFFKHGQIICQLLIGVIVPKSGFLLVCMYFGPLTKVKKRNFTNQKLSVRQLRSANKSNIAP